MLKACKYCGKIHAKNFVCGKKPTRKIYKTTPISKFRSSKAWTEKSIEIRERDNYLCQICKRGLYHTVNRFTFQNVSVHHAVPISEDWERRLDNENLLTVCAMHHEMAEDGTIPREEIRRIIDEQERHPPGESESTFPRSQDQHPPILLK